MAHERTKIFGHPDEPESAAPPNGNGKKWWRETWGKAVGTVLGAVLLGVLILIWTKTVALAATTMRVYETPARVDALEAWKATLPSPQPPLDPALVKKLDAFLTAAAKQQEKRKP